MFTLHDLNPDALSAELAWRREGLRHRGNFLAPRWRPQSTGRRRTARRTK